MRIYFTNLIYKLQKFFIAFFYASCVFFLDFILKENKEIEKEI